MKNLIGKTIEVRGAKYQVTGFKPMEFAYIRRLCEQTRKYPAYFFASKILRNGKLSEKQTIVCLFFKDSENFITL